MSTAAATGVATSTANPTARLVHGALLMARALDAARPGRGRATANPATAEPPGAAGDDEPDGGGHRPGRGPGGGLVPDSAGNLGSRSHCRLPRAPVDEGAVHARGGQDLDLSSAEGAASVAL